VNVRFELIKKIEEGNEELKIKSALK